MLSQCGYSDPVAASSALTTACAKTCDSCVKVGGDPIFRKGDRWVKFTIGTWAQRTFATRRPFASALTVHPLNACMCRTDPKAGLTPLLSWAVGARKYELSAATLAHTNGDGGAAADNAQWFSSVALKIDGKQVFIAEIGESPNQASATHTMAVNLDNKILKRQEAKSDRTGLQVAVAQQKHRHAIHKRAPERIRVTLEDGLEFDVSSAAAFRPYKHNEHKQAKFAHLNVCRTHANARTS